MLKLDGISFSYQNKKIISDLNFTAERGDLTLLTGPSGVGKSTLARIIAGHLHPDSGRVLLDGTDRTGKPTRDIFMVSQDHDLFPWQTVEQHLSFVASTIGDDLNRTNIDEILQLVELDKTKTSYPKELSGGMQRRLALARALVLRPKVMILDEVFGSQDETLRDKLLSRLKSFWYTQGTIVFVISHDRDLKAVISGRSIVLG